jgi:hypothetical protein
MFAGNQWSVISCNNNARSPVASGYSCRQRLFRPWAVAFIALLILWGFGYKLSRYDSDSDPTSRVLSAKLWDKHQDVAQAADPAKLPGQPQLQPALHAALISLHQIPTVEHHEFLPPDECRRVPGLFGSVIPLRSPPQEI